MLPALPPGVHVHIHDVFLPDGYPPNWAWRGYNEQNAVAALLASGGLSPALVLALRRDAHGRRTSRPRGSTLPLLPGAHETSLWLVKA